MKKILLAAACLLSLAGCTKNTDDEGRGWAAFYTPNNAHGTINITISGDKINSIVFKVPVTTDPDSYCTNGWTGTVYLNIGQTYNYTATAADGSKWNGTFNVSKDYCTQKLLQ